MWRILSRLLPIPAQLRGLQLDNFNRELDHTKAFDRSSAYDTSVHDRLVFSCEHRYGNNYECLYEDSDLSEFDGWKWQGSFVRVEGFGLTNVEF